LSHNHTSLLRCFRHSSPVTNPQTLSFHSTSWLCPYCRCCLVLLHAIRVMRAALCMFVLHAPSCRSAVSPHGHAPSCNRDYQTRHLSQAPCIPPVGATFCWTFVSGCSDFLYDLFSVFALHTALCFHISRIVFETCPPPIFSLRIPCIW